MNQLTTIASLPSGSGQAAHMKPEIGTLRAPFSGFCDSCETCSECLKNGCIPEVSGHLYAPGKAAYLSKLKSYVEGLIGSPPLLKIDPDMLDTSE